MKGVKALCFKDNIHSTVKAVKFFYTSIIQLQLPMAIIHVKDNNEKM